MTRFYLIVLALLICGFTSLQMLHDFAFLSCSSTNETTSKSARHHKKKMVTSLKQSVVPIPSTPTQTPTVDLPRNSPFPSPDGVEPINESNKTASIDETGSLMNPAGPVPSASSELKEAVEDNVGATTSPPLPKKEKQEPTIVESSAPMQGSPSASSSSPLSRRFQPRKLHFFTFADSGRPPLCLLAASALQHGYELNVLAWDHSETFADGKNCSDKCKRASGWRHAQERKMYWQANLYYNAEAYGIHEDDLILFTDAFDVVIQNNLSQIPELFLRHTGNERGIVFNGEPACGDSFFLGGAYGDQLRAKTYQVRLTSDSKPRKIQGSNMCNMMAAKASLHGNVQGPYFGLNSGIFVGDVRTLRFFFDRIRKVIEESDANGFHFDGDQILSQIVYLRYPELNVHVDTDASISFVVSYLTVKGDLDHFDPEKGCASTFLKDNKPSTHHFGDTKPILLHFPGDYKGHYEGCARNVLSKAEKEVSDAYFIDFDRKKRVFIKEICPNGNF